eukprot:GHVN01097731.1.p1 GENE.GHVN01097731.1~~GHVN01097731.1.p1  ORF type:complete len:155 (+),score=10.65 GHVN01097731.1:1-465(+)
MQTLKMRRLKEVAWSLEKISVWVVRYTEIFLLCLNTYNKKIDGKLPKEISEDLVRLQTIREIVGSLCFKAAKETGESVFLAHANKILQKTEAFLAKGVEIEQDLFIFFRMDIPRCQKEITNRMGIYSSFIQGSSAALSSATSSAKTLFKSEICG